MREPVRSENTLWLLVQGVPPKKGTRSGLILRRIGKMGIVPEISSGFSSLCRSYPDFPYENHDFPFSNSSIDCGVSRISPFLASPRPQAPAERCWSLASNFSDLEMAGTPELNNFPKKSIDCPVGNSSRISWNILEKGKIVERHELSLGNLTSKEFAVCFSCLIVQGFVRWFCCSNLPQALREPPHKNVRSWSWTLQLIMIFPVAKILS